MENYYHLFEVSADAELSEIRTAFRKQAKSCHPDLYQQATEQERHQQQLKFVRFSQAYETLADPKKRKAYDQKLSQFKSKSNHQQQQKTRTSSSSSSSSKRSNFEYKYNQQFNHSTKSEAKEELEGLLKEVEELLGKYGGGFKDPLEMLVDWAKVIYKEVIDAWNEEEPKQQNPKDTESHQQKKNENKAQSHKHSNAFDEIEEELQRLKQEHEEAKKSGTFTGIKTKKSEMEQELQNLKNKYRL